MPNRSIWPFLLLLLAVGACSSDSLNEPEPPATRQITVTRTGDGTGTVTSTPAGIDCGDTCSASFDAGISVTLTATPAQGSVFAGWNGACLGAQATCAIPAGGTPGSVQAGFTRANHVLTVVKSGGGAGMVTSNVGGIECGVQCDTELPHGTEVTLEAAPFDGSIFIGWSGGACAGVAPCVVTIMAATSITATFGVLQQAWPDSHTRYCMADGVAASCSEGEQGQDGHYTLNVPTYAVAGGRVFDSVTGLVWQRTIAFTWMTQQEAIDYCNQLEVDGFTDWRLPSYLELASLIDNGRRGPAFPDVVTHGVVQNTFFWTSTLNGDDATQAYAAASNWGTFRRRDVTESEERLVRCVRGATFAGGLVAVGNTVEDQRTHLVWQSGAAPALLTWADALAYCEGLVLDGHDDWRLPSHKELLTIVDVARTVAPRISPLFASRPTTLPEREFWSSTPLPWDEREPAEIFILDLSEGGSIQFSRFVEEEDGTPVFRNARCVRGGSA